MRKGTGPQCDSRGNLSWKERRRSKRCGRRNCWYDSLRQRPRLWQCALIASLLPAAVVPFQPPSSSKVVPIRSTKRSCCSSEKSRPNGRQSRLALASTVEKTPQENTKDLEFDDHTELSDVSESSVEISGLEEGVVIAEYPQRNGVAHKNGAQAPPSVKEFWEPRHARSIQEGIRRETSSQLSSLLDKAKSFATDTSSSATNSGRRYAARTIAGLIHALAEEADGLEVEVDANKDTPMWEKKVDAVRIQFSRLGFKPLRISGLDRALQKLESALPSEEKLRTLDLAAVCCPDEAFDRIDADKSGALDQEEIASALNVAAATDSDKELLEGLASELLELYDFNGDGVVDRDEYQSMVEDMAALNREKKEREEEADRSRKEQANGNTGWKGMIKSAVKTVRGDSAADDSPMATEKANGTDINDLPDDPVIMDSISKGEGSIVISDLKLDLRRLLFGLFPLVKKITPGGPLILEPFTMTVSGSFDADDVMESFLLDAGLRRLVTRVLRRRIFFRLRDLLDGAMFYGRTWKMTSDHAPLVEVPKLERVEFDKKDRMIVTGRTRVRTSPDSPSIEQAFKIRCKIGTRAGGRVIRLVDPELALVIECPKAWERNIVSACQKMNMPVPTRPQPIYSYFPIYSRFKVEDKDGFDLGEDNRIKSIFIKDGALRFEMSAVLRPGRFLGNHYLAFTVPTRTFIITMERVREGIRAARKNKQEAKAARKRAKDANGKPQTNSSLSFNEDQVGSLKFKDPPVRNGVSLFKAEAPRPAPTVPTKSFFSRFVEGYLGSKETKEELHEIRTERLTAAISDWFGRQGSSDDDSTEEEE